MLLLLGRLRRRRERQHDRLHLLQCLAEVVAHTSCVQAVAHDMEATATVLSPVADAVAATGRTTRSGEEHPGDKGAVRVVPQRGETTVRAKDTAQRATHAHVCATRR